MRCCLLSRIPEKDGLLSQFASVLSTMQKPVPIAVILEDVSVANEDGAPFCALRRCYMGETTFCLGPKSCLDRGQAGG